MKHYCFLFLLVLFASLSCIVLCEEPIVTITLDVARVEVGHPVTAYYSIENFDQYCNISINARINLEDPYSFYFLASKTIEEATGSFQVTPSYGYYLSFSVSLTDEKNVWYSFDSERIPIVGWEPNYTKITITPSKTSVKLGETVTFKYSIEGDIQMDTINAGFGGKVFESEWATEWQSFKKKIKLTKKNGTFTGTADFGYDFYAAISLKDINGQNHSVSSPSIVITDYEPLTPTITITADKSTAKPGETITFKYSFSGPGKYKDYNASIQYSYMPDVYTFGSSIPLETQTGVFTAETKSCLSMIAGISLYDQRGQYYGLHSVEIFIQNENEKWLVFPRKLTRIEAGAFKTTDFDHIWIPDTVTYIADDAFEGISNKIIIYGKSGSAAETYANDKGYDFVWY